MASRVSPGPVQDGDTIREAVCIHTNKIYDSCKDKDCLEDLRLYPTMESQAIINSACSVRARSAELLYVMTNVESIAFNRGYFAVDMSFFYRVRGEAFGSGARPCEICGLAVFNKRVILFGSEGSAKVFSSATPLEVLSCESFTNSSLPTAYVEAVDPIVLDMKIVDNCSCGMSDCDLFDLPSAILSAFDGPLTLDACEKRVYVSLGQFSIVRLERDSQLLIPTYDYCMPEKECTGSETGDPCSLFEQVNFPIEEFFPPDSVTIPECYREALGSQGR